MNEKEYKRLLDQIEPDNSLREKVWRNLESKTSFFPRLKLSAVAFVTLIVVGFVLISSTLNSENTNGEYKLSNSKKVVPESPNMDKDFKKSGETFNGVTIPKFEIPNSISNSNMAADTLANSFSYFVYQCRVYVQNNSAKFSTATGKSLIGTKIGITTGNHDNDCYGSTEKTETPNNVEDFSSNSSGLEIYTVNGYDPTVRLMGYSSGPSRIEFYDCWNGKTIFNGLDVFGELNFLGNIEMATWETPQNSLNGDTHQQSIKLNSAFQKMIKGLYLGKPILQKDLLVKDIFEKKDQKVVILTLKNGIEEKLYFFEKQKMVLHLDSHVYFKVADKIFDDFYESLK
ncbi:MAG: hypothetical protein K0R18_1802 [Bacillales bacterium]|jgi:hypothetical protein|nr:hypothetical protein [Bacillales bacterium]